MVSRLLACAVLLLASPGIAFGQDAASTVSPFEPAFFTEFRPNTALDMIGRLPGFTFDAGSLERGFAGTAGNVLIDGERPPSRSDGLADVLARIPASSVARIDLIRGGAPGIDMLGRAIMANVIRKPDGGLSGSAYGRLDIDDEHGFEKDIELQGLREAGGGRIEGSVALGSYLDEPHPVRVRRRLNGAVSEMGLANAHYQFDRAIVSGSTENTLLGGRLRANAQVGYETNDDATDEELIIPGGAITYRGDRDRVFGEGGLRFTRNLSGGFDLELVGFYSESQEDSASASVFPSFSSNELDDRNSGESIGTVTLHTPSWRRWKFDFGTEAAFNWSEAVLLQSVDGEPFPLDGDKSRVEELRYDTRAVGTWTPSPAFNLEAGVRYEHSTISAGEIENVLGFIKPRFNASWTPRPKHQLGLLIERTVDQLSFSAFESSVDFNSTFGDSIVGVGNNNLTPQNQWIAKASYERRWAREGVLSVSLSHRRIEDYVSREVIDAPTADNPARTVERTANVGPAEATELKAGLALPLDEWGLSGGLFRVGLTFRESELRDPVDRTLMREISGETPFDWEMTFLRNIPDWNLTWSFYAQGSADSRNYAPRSISEFDNVMRVRFDLNWQPRPGLTLTGGVRNITKAANANHLVFYAAPRGRGGPAYTESMQFTGFRSVFFSLRKDLR